MSSLLRLCKRKQPIDSLSLSDEAFGSEISHSSDLFCSAQSDINIRSHTVVAPWNATRVDPSNSEVPDMISNGMKLQDEMTDSLNAVTDRINMLELGFSDQSEQLREELILFKQSVKHILTELMKSLRVLVSSPPQVQRQARSNQSRIGMRSRQVRPRNYAF